MLHIVWVVSADKARLYVRQNLYDNCYMQLSKSLLKLGPGVLDKLRKFRRVNGNLPITPRQEIALQNMNENITAGSNLLNLIGRNRVERAISAKLDARPLWERILKPSSDKALRNSTAQGTDALRHLSYDTAAHNGQVDRYNTLFNSLVNNAERKHATEFKFNPTKLVPKEHGSWEVDAVPRVNTAASLKEYQNLPKNIRGAYEAGHYVNPDPMWGLKEMTSGNNLPYQPR